MCTFSNCKENSLGVISIITCSVLKRCHWTVAQKNMKCEENQNRCFNDRQCFESQIASKLNNHKELLMDWPLKKKMSIQTDWNKGAVSMSQFWKRLLLSHWWQLCIFIKLEKKRKHIASPWLRTQYLQTKESPGKLTFPNAHTA